MTVSWSFKEWARRPERWFGGFRSTCSFSGPRFGSQDPQGGSKVHRVPVPGDPTPSVAPGMAVVHIHTKKTPIYINKSKRNKRKGQKESGCHVSASFAFKFSSLPSSGPCSTHSSALPVCCRIAGYLVLPYLRSSSRALAPGVRPSPHVR